MDVKYEITRKSEFANFPQFLYTIFYLIVGVAYCIFKNGNGSASFFISFFIGLIILESIPVYLLHKSYYDANKGDEMVCDFENKSISYQHNDNNIQFTADEIDSIKYYRSKARQFPWYKYNYLNVKLMNGESINITSLLVPDIKSFIANMHFDENRIVKIESFVSSTVIM
jgi:hypothetical protein